MEKNTILNLDKIYDAYMGKWGDEAKLKTNERINWIAENVVGCRVLDVGCSQGITSLLLARENKTVVGIDVVQESIDFANSILENEGENTKQNLNFECASILSFNSGERFDTIILGEILEHILYTEDIINKTMALLKKDGRVIVSIPFGISIYYDHKKTFYIGEILDAFRRNFSLVDIKYFGDWAGFCFDFCEQADPVDWIKVIKDLEKEIIKHESKLLGMVHEDRVAALEKENASLQLKLNGIKESRSYHFAMLISRTLHKNKHAE